MIAGHQLICRFSLVLILAGLSTGTLADELLVYLDLDASATSGCTLSTVEGPYAGVEQVLITRHENAQVTQVVRRECTDPAANALGPEILVSSGGWPVGLGLGASGSDVVETFVSLADLGPTQPVILVAFATRDAAGADADAVLGTAAGGLALQAIGDQRAVAVPALQQLGLWLLMATLAVLGLRRVSHHPGLRSFAMVLLLAGGMVGLVWAAISTDGDPSDWTGQPPLATDPVGDGGGSDLVAVFGRSAGNRLNFRADVIGVNDAPVADAQDVSSDEDTPVTISLTGSDPEGDPLTFAIAAPANNGTLGALTPLTPTSANVRYTPNLNHLGADSFTFTVSDGSLTSAPATVSITVQPVNDAPVADGQALSTDEDTPVTITLTGSDPEGDPLTFAIATTASNGTLGVVTALNPTSASVLYTPNPNHVGPDSFTFTVSDGSRTSAPATVSITVQPVNDAPVADSQAVSSDEDTPVTITLTGSDPEGSPLTFAIATIANNGNLGALTPPTPSTSASVLYTPNPNHFGSDSFTFTVSDGSLTSAPATVSITVDPVNDAPAADSQALSTDEDTPVTITLTGSDPEGSPLTFAIATIANNGNLGAPTQPTPSTSASVLYTPNPNYFGPDEFTFTVSDDGGITSAAAAVSITVNAVNDPPVVNPEPSYSVSSSLSEFVVNPVGGLLDPNIIDDSADGSSPRTFSIKQPAPVVTELGGSLAITVENGGFTYSLPAAAARGDTDRFTYEICDDGVPGSACTAVTATINLL